MEKKVNDLVSIGWVPQGGISAVGGTHLYCQALVFVVNNPEAKN